MKIESSRYVGHVYRRGQDGNGDLVGRFDSDDRVWLMDYLRNLAPDVELIIHMEPINNIQKRADAIMQSGEHHTSMMSTTTNQGEQHDNT